jgi:hypothetical protein
LTGGEAGEDGASCRIGESSEGGVEAARDHLSIA